MCEFRKDEVGFLEHGGTKINFLQLRSGLEA